MYSALLQTLPSFVLLLCVAEGVLGAGSASKPPVSTIEPSLTQIQAAAATASSLSPASDVKGVAFDRFFQVWLENTDYNAAAGDPNQQWLAKQGITLTNYWATTHPSEPNYCATVGGDNFGIDSDDFVHVPANVSTVVDLLDLKGISWAEYQEDIPYPGFQGFNYSNQKTFANDYVRKHNPLISFDSVTQNATRLELIKGFTALGEDLANQRLPQWAFITPNMTDDGHDTNITFASLWERSAVSVFLNNSYFMNNTLVLLTFDETETYTDHNKIFAILLGGAIPANLKGTTDDTFYNHYSAISTVSMNWGLPSLGRWDCSANVYALVANKTGYKNYNVDTTNLYFNESIPGPLSDDAYIPTWPVPATDSKCAGGKGVLSSVVSTYGKMKPTFNYSSPYPYDDSSKTNTGGSVSGGPAANSSSSGGATGSSSGASSSASSTGTALSLAVSHSAIIGMILAFAVALVI